MKASVVERRHEPRSPAVGEVRLRHTGEMAGAFVGRLVDMSPSGFRIRHSRLTLASGDRVDFEWQGQSGVARVMWHRIVGEEAETGFSVTK
jgi:hypothetical protein